LFTKARAIAPTPRKPLWASSLNATCSAAIELAAAGRRHPDHAHQRSARRVIVTLLTLGGGTAGA
jgi:gentisate 1,2-dioxygenase